MSNLVKISNVTMYFGENNFSEQFQCKNFLDSNNILYSKVMIMANPSDFFTSMSQNVFGDLFTMYTFSSFPIITWTEYYDDYDRFDNVSQSFSELTTSTLVTNASLIR
jgi:hypothetical protein